MARASHSPLALLARQFKSLMSLEANVSPEHRVQHQWQLLATVGNRTHVILKAGANTIGYRVVIKGKESSAPEWKYMFPTDMLKILEELQSSKYIGYALVQGGKPIKKHQDIRALLEQKPKHTSTIVGVTHDNKRVKLYQWQTGVFDADWKKLK